MTATLISPEPMSRPTVVFLRPKERAIGNRKEKTAGATTSLCGDVYGRVPNHFACFRRSTPCRVGNTTHTDTGNRGGRRTNVAPCILFRQPANDHLVGSETARAPLPNDDHRSV